MQLTIDPDDFNELISSIGSELIEHAQDFGEPMRLPLTTQLFPYLLVASRRMTTREISGWLESAKQVKLSAVAISKGLKRPELHLKRIAEYVQAPAVYLAMVYDHSAEALLFDPGRNRTWLEELGDVIFADPEGPSEGVADSYRVLSEFWAPIPDEVKYMCRRYFDFDPSDSDDATDDDSTQQAE